MDKEKVWLGIIGEIKIKYVNQSNHDKNIEILNEVDSCLNINEFI
jgi:hypothetical protein